MKTIQMTIDDSLLDEVDRLTAQLQTTRSDFIREALQSALQKHSIAALERQHAQGYTRQPVAPGEFDVWTDEQVWAKK